MLSKSQYTKYLQCPKLFWLYRKRKEKITPPNTQQQHIFDTGTRVGELACGLFPDGVEVPFDIQNIVGMAQKTKDLINDGETIIYEASFLFDGIFAAVDILHFRNGVWHIYEVKSSTGLKDTYRDDVAIQAYILEQSGLEIGSANIVHINNQYVRGSELDLHSLFTIVDITTDAIRRKHQIPLQIETMKQLLHQNEPMQDIGPHCFVPYECSARDYCWKELAKVPENSVFDLTRATMSQKLELYGRGVIKVTNIPLIGRTSAQQLQISNNKFIDVEQIQQFMTKLEYPITHLDFETFQQAIPEYEGIKPFQQIPFQYSMHIENKSSCKHKDYLALNGIDPRRELAERLLSDVPAKGTVLAYNSSFEKRVIRGMAEAFPDLREHLLALASRIYDLMLPFQKRWYYHPDMNGSYSIKKVLPALIPEMVQAYTDLPGVRNGGEASASWSCLATIEDPKEREKVRNGLLEYCKLDTLAMVKILAVLREI